MEYIENITPTSLPQQQTSAKSPIVIIIVIVVLAILGFNLFSYLAKGTNIAAYIIQKFLNLLSFLMKFINKGTEKTMDLTKVGVTEVAGSKKEKKNIKKALEKKKKKKSPKIVAESTDAKQIQTGKKKGWCYIGSYRDYRSCLKVGKDDTCVSDEIFPTKEQCENPNLR